jgi:cysteinyl-tRNA synthetase
MANIWMHNGFLQVEGEKMSKSLGNFITIRDLLETGNFGDSTWPGEVLRLAMLRSHYRDPIDWTVRALERALEDLREWYSLFESNVSSNAVVDSGVSEALCDDLNTHAALVRLHELAKSGDIAALRASLGFLGFSCDSSRLARKVYVAARSGFVASGRAVVTVTAEVAHFDDPSLQMRVEELIARRKAARAAKDFAEADKIRDELSALSVAIKDNKDGTTSWEPKR